MTTKTDEELACRKCGAPLLQDGDWKLCSGCGMAEVSCRCPNAKRAPHDEQNARLMTEARVLPRG